jgi:isocitrate/isopropylmalate dehydrogenase
MLDALVLNSDILFPAFMLNLLQEYALFEPGCRHVASDIMGTNRANPTAMVLSATMMLRHLGYVSLSRQLTVPPLTLVPFFS